MRRTIVNFYIDIVPSFPEMTDEEFEAELERLDEESKKLTEWPEIL